MLKKVVPAKARFQIGFYFLTAVVLVTICYASEAKIVRLASPDATEGAPPDSCRPALTGQGEPAAWQVLFVHNRAALAEMSRVGLDNRFPLCVVDAVKASDIDIGVSFAPIAGAEGFLQQLGRVLRGGNAKARESGATSLRGASRRSNPVLLLHGLLRYARNDGVRAWLFENLESASDDAGSIRSLPLAEVG